MTAPRAELIHIEVDRRLGHEWDEWDGKPLANAGNFDAPARLFLVWIVATMLVAFAIACWRRPSPLQQRCAVLLLATVLVAPHLTVYDLVILAPAFLWIAEWLQTNAAPRIAWLLYLAYILPFAGPLARWTHLQFSVIALAALAMSVGLRLRDGYAQPARS